MSVLHKVVRKFLFDIATTYLYYHLLQLHFYFFFFSPHFINYLGSSLEQHSVIYIIAHYSLAFLEQNGKCVYCNFKKKFCRYEGDSECTTVLLSLRNILTFKFTQQLIQQQNGCRCISPLNCNDVCMYDLYLSPERQHALCK